MQPCNHEILELQAELYQTMANAKRLAIVELLSHGEMCVGALADALETSICTISQHLRILRDKNIVTMRREGHTVYYRLKHRRTIEGCHLVREILLETMQAQGLIARDFNEETTLTK